MFGSKVKVKITVTVVVTARVAVKVEFTVRAALIHSLVFKCIDGLRIKQTFLLLRQTAFK
jgi:hypothetical protein